MSRRVIILALVALATISTPGPARASDPLGAGKLDLRTVVVHRMARGDTRIRIVTHGTWTIGAVSQATHDRFFVLFDTNNDGTSDYRGTIETNGTNNLHIAIVGRHYGLGPLSVGHPNRHTAVVVVPRRTKPNPHHAWGLAVRSRFQGHGGTCASPCIDRVPAVGWLRVPP